MAYNDPANRWLIRSWHNGTTWDVYPPKNNPYEFQCYFARSFEEARQFVSRAIEWCKKQTNG